MDLIDPDLHEIGIIQSEIHKSIVEQINVKIVFVSPIQRAMQTTIHMFKDHPSKEHIQFKVLPLVREILNTSNDVAIDCYDLVDKYAHGKEICHGIKFDFH